MIISAISIVGVISGLLFGKGHYDTFFPVHVSTGSAVVSGIIAIILLAVYFYFSYQLLLGTQSVSTEYFSDYLLMIQKQQSRHFVGKLIADVRISHHPRYLCRSFHPRSIQ